MKIKRLIKIVIINFILFLFIIPKSFTKPIPPGTGEGDVPANILILLDSSVSMRNLVSGGEGTYGIDWSVELSDGSIIFAENGRGFSKFLDLTKRVPLKRHGEHQELANLAGYLLSDYSAYMTSEVVTLDGGEWTYNAGQFTRLDKVPKSLWGLIE